MNRIAAIVGIGIQLAYGIRITRIRERRPAWTIPAPGERPHFWMFAAVRTGNGACSRNTAK